MMSYFLCFEIAVCALAEWEAWLAWLTTCLQLIIDCRQTKHALVSIKYTPQAIHIDSWCINTFTDTCAPYFLQIYIHPLVSSALVAKWFCFMKGLFDHLLYLHCGHNDHHPDQHNLNHPLLIDDQQPLDDQETACIKFVDISSTGHATVSSWRSHGRNYFYQNLPPPAHFVEKIVSKEELPLLTKSFTQFLHNCLFFLNIVYKIW